MARRMAIYFSMQAMPLLLNIVKLFVITTKPLTFNKRDLLSVLKPYGIKSLHQNYLNLGDEIKVDDNCKSRLPCFVKPNKSI
jgi:hypothetical protein